MNPPPRIFDPRVVPIAGTDGHLPPVPVWRLQPDALRLRFAAPPSWQPEFSGDGRFFTERTPRDASVLVPLVERADGLHVLLTQRAERLRDHAGQISFPGGRAEPDDADPVATALREAAEEIGLAGDSAEVLGSLPSYATVTSYVVTPVVALLKPPLVLQLDPGEVDAAFEVPLQYLMTPAHHQRHVWQYEGGQRQFLSMPWRPAPEAPEFFIWGATAAMLRNLYRFLAA